MARKPRSTRFVVETEGESPPSKRFVVETEDETEDPTEAEAAHKYRLLQAEQLIKDARKDNSG